MSEDDRQPGSSPSLDKLSERIAEKLDARAKAEEKEKDASQTARSMTGMRAATDLFAGIVVGLIIGWGLDRLLGTSPWFLLASVPLGTAAGIMNAWRSARAATEEPDAEERDET